MSFDIVLAMTFMIIMHDLGTTLGKLQLIEDGIIGPILLLLLISGTPLEPSLGPL